MNRQRLDLLCRPKEIKIGQIWKTKLNPDIFDAHRESFIIVLSKDLGDGLRSKIDLWRVGVFFQCNTLQSLGGACTYDVSDDELLKNATYVKDLNDELFPKENSSSKENIDPLPGQGNRRIMETCDLNISITPKDDNDN